jgi:hypothetical protein
VTKVEKQHLTICGKRWTVRHIHGWGKDAQGVSYTGYIHWDKQRIDLSKYALINERIIALASCVEAIWMNEVQKASAKMAVNARMN